MCGGWLGHGDLQEPRPKARRVLSGLPRKSHRRLSLILSTQFEAIDSQYNQPGCANAAPEWRRALSHEPENAAPGNNGVGVQEYSRCRFVPLSGLHSSVDVLSFTNVPFPDPRAAMARRDATADASVWLWVRAGIPLEALRLAPLQIPQGCRVPTRTVLQAFVCEYAQPEPQSCSPPRSWTKGHPLVGNVFAGLCQAISDGPLAK